MCTPTAPEAVFSYAARWGRVETTKADDMRAQHRRLAHPERRAVRDRDRHLGRPAGPGARPSSHRPGPAAGGLRRRDLSRPGGAQAGGVLPPAARGAGAADHLPADARGLRPGAPRRPGRGGRSGRGPALGGPVGHLRVGAGGGAGGGDQRCPPGGQPLRVAGARACSPCAGRSWRRRAGGGRRSRGSSSGFGASPGCCSRWTATTTCSGPDGSPAERRGSPECWT